jgi:hypothetical protein
MLPALSFIVQNEIGNAHRNISVRLLKVHAVIQCICVTHSYIQEVSLKIGTAKSNTTYGYLIVKELYAHSIS